MISRFPSKDRGLVVLDREPKKFLFGAWYNVSIPVWVGQADAAAVARLQVAAAKLAAEYPEARSCVTVINPGLPLPTDDEARARFIGILSRSAQQLANFAVVVLGTGFERSAVLAYHTNVHFASSGSCEMGFLDSIEGLARWLPERHRKTGIDLDPARLIAIVKEAVEVANRP